MPNNQSNGPIGWPIIVVDFEATALTHDSYPIEVGIAVARSLGTEIEAWSSIIAPHQTWNLDDRWDHDAERVHGISRWQVRNGTPADEVMLRLNELAGCASSVWCDGGHYDVYWLAKLAEAACVTPHFALRDIAAVLGDDPQMRERYREQLAQSIAPHRAGPDAKRICAALLAASHRKVE